jgi:hypothetical protein
MAQHLDSLKAVFVETRGIGAAQSTLETSGMVVLKGNTGDGKTDRKTDRQTDRHTDIQTYRQAYRENTHRQTEKTFPNSK